MLIVILIIIYTVDFKDIGHGVLGESRIIGVCIIINIYLLDTHGKQYQQLHQDRTHLMWRCHQEVVLLNTMWSINTHDRSICYIN